MFGQSRAWGDIFNGWMKRDDGAGRIMLSGSSLRQGMCGLIVECGCYTYVRQGQSNPHPRPKPTSTATNPPTHPNNPTTLHKKNQQRTARPPLQGLNRPRPQHHGPQPHKPHPAQRLVPRRLIPLPLAGHPPPSSLQRQEGLLRALVAAAVAAAAAAV